MLYPDRHDNYILDYSIYVKAVEDLSLYKKILYQEVWGYSEILELQESLGLKISLQIQIFHFVCVYVCLV